MADGQKYNNREGESNMKRKTMIMTAAMLIALGGAVALNGQDAQAAKKQPVKAVVKGSTLTISGKGAMPSNLKVKKSQKNKVKKIVVKKGITSIPVNAFTTYKNIKSATVATSVKKIGQNAFKCDKLEELTIPGDFTITSLKGGKAEYWISDKVNTVTFNTNLNIERAAAFDTNNLVVKKSDPKYKSIGGIIYSKDGKEIVRVPYQRGEVVLEKDCEVFCLQSVKYCNVDAIGYASGGCRVKKIVIPESVKKVESDNYYALSDLGLDKRIVNDRITGLQVEVKSKQLDDSSIIQLAYYLEMDLDTLMTQLPDQISLKDEMYFTNTSVLLKYCGKDSKIEIPEGTKKIGDYAFYNYCGIVELVLPEGLEEIGNFAFYRSSIGTSETDYQYIKKLILPDSLIKIGNAAFVDNHIEEIQFGKNIKEIGDEAFVANSLVELTIPATVTKLGKQAFCGQWNALDVVIQGSSAGFSDQVFEPNFILSYEMGAREQRVTLYSSKPKYVSTKKMKATVRWTAVRDAEGYEIVTATNAKFTKNKNQVMVKGDLKEKTLTMKGKFKKNTKVYVKVRPYSYLDGKKVYGRWSQVAAE